MREPRIIKMRRDQAVECDLYQQIKVELGEDPQCVARAFRPDISVPHPRDQRMKVPRSHELRCEFHRRPLLERQIISERHLTRLLDRKKPSDGSLQARPAIDLASAQPRVEDLRRVRSARVGSDPDVDLTQGTDHWRRLLRHCSPRNVSQIGLAGVPFWRAHVR